MLLEQQLAIANEKQLSSLEQHGSKEYIDGLRTKIKIQVSTTKYKPGYGCLGLLTSVGMF